MFPSFFSSNENNCHNFLFVSLGEVALVLPKWGLLIKNLLQLEPLEFTYINLCFIYGGRRGTGVKSENYSFLSEIVLRDLIMEHTPNHSLLKVLQCKICAGLCANCVHSDKVGKYAGKKLIIFQYKYFVLCK